MRVAQFKIHSCFRTEVRPRNPHTPIPKLAFVDTLDSSGNRMEWGNIKREMWLCSLRFTLASEPKWTLFRLQWQEYGMGKQKEGIFLSQKENWTWNNFVKLELELFRPKRRGKRNWTWNKCVQGREGVGLRMNWPSKREKRR